MKKCILFLLMAVISISLLSQNTRRVDVHYHDRTTKFATYTPIASPSIKLPENNFSKSTATDLLEDRVKQARLREEMAELEELKTLRRQRALERQHHQTELNESNTQTKNMYQINIPNKASKQIEDNICIVFSSSPLYNIPNWTKGESVTTSKDGTAKIISKYNDEYYWAEMNGVKGYLWSGWIKE